MIGCGTMNIDGLCKSKFTYTTWSQNLRANNMADPFGISRIDFLQDSLWSSRDRSKQCFFCMQIYCKVENMKYHEIRVTCCSKDSSPTTSGNMSLWMEILCPRGKWLYIYQLPISQEASLFQPSFIIPGSNCLIFRVSSELIGTWHICPSIWPT